MQQTLDQVLRIGSIPLQMTSPSIQAGSRLQKFADEHDSKTLLGMRLQLPLQQKKNGVNWRRVEKVTAIFVQAPLGAVWSYFLHIASGFEGF